MQKFFSCQSITFSFSSKQNRYLSLAGHFSFSFFLHLKASAKKQDIRILRARFAYLVFTHLTQGLARSRNHIKIVRSKQSQHTKPYAVYLRLDFSLFF